MNTFLKTLVGTAYIAIPATTTYAVVPDIAQLVSKERCEAESTSGDPTCIDNLANYIQIYDGTTEIKDLGGLD